MTYTIASLARAVTGSVQSISVIIDGETVSKPFIVANLKKTRWPIVYGFTYDFNANRYYDEPFVLSNCVIRILSLRFVIDCQLTMQFKGNQYLLNNPFPNMRLIAFNPTNKSNIITQAQNAELPEFTEGFIKAHNPFR